MLLTASPAIFVILLEFRPARPGRQLQGVSGELKPGDTSSRCGIRASTAAGCGVLVGPFAAAHPPVEQGLIAHALHGAWAGLPTAVSACRRLARA